MATHQPYETIFQLTQPLHELIVPQEQDTDDIVLALDAL